jgi:tetratricopeptide (TPR) repeat protein
MALRAARLGQSRPADAIGPAHEAVSHAQAAGDDEALAHAYHLLDRAHAALEDHPTAARYRDLALPVFAAVGDLAAQGTVLYDLGADAQRAGKLDEALWLYERSSEVRTRAGDILRAAESANAIGEVLILLGRSAQAHDRFAEALRTWRGARSPRGVAEATHNLGVVALRGGDPEQALGLLDEAAELALRIGAERLHQRIQLPLAEALLVSGRYVEAWDAAGRVVDAADPQLAARAHRLRANALLCTGGTARARAELTTAVALADAAGDADGVAAAQRLLARTDDA